MNEPEEFEKETPNEALVQVIDWLGIDRFTTVTRRSDGVKITVMLMSEEIFAKMQERLEFLKSKES